MKVFAFCEKYLGRLSETGFYLVLLALLMAIVTSLMTLSALELHSNFLTLAADTAVFQNAIVNTLDGNWFRDTAYDGPNLLGLHCIPILFPVAMVYAILPFTTTLFVLQVWGIYSAVFPLYLLGLETLRKPVLAFLVAASALASPIFIHMALAPFHPETWIITAVLWTCYFYRRNNLKGFWISLGIGLGCSEQSTLIYASLGLTLLLFDDGMTWRKKYGIYALITAAVWFVFSVCIVIPIMRQPFQHNLIAYNYSNWNVTTMGGLAGAVIHNARDAATMLTSSIRWERLFGLIGLPLVLVIFSPRALVLMAPFPIYFLMSDQEFFLPIHGYYFQFAFVAGYLGLLFGLTRQPDPGRLGGLALASTLFVNVLLLFPTSLPYTNLLQQTDDAFSADVHQAFASIPGEAGVYCPHRYSAYLSNRANLVMGDLNAPGLDFNSMVDDRNVSTSVHSSDIDFIVCDVRNDQCGPRMAGFDPAVAKIRSDNLTRLVQSGQWKVAWNQNDVVILRRVRP